MGNIKRSQFCSQKNDNELLLLMESILRLIVPGPCRFLLSLQYRYIIRFRAGPHPEKDILRAKFLIFGGIC